MEESNIGRRGPIEVKAPPTVRDHPHLRPRHSRQLTAQAGELVEAGTPLLVFSIGGLKQNVKSLLTPASGTFFHALSHGGLHLVLHCSTRIMKHKSMKHKGQYSKKGKK